MPCTFSPPAAWLRLLPRACTVCLSAMACLLVVAVACLHAQSPRPVAPHAGLAPEQKVSVEQYRQHLDALRQLVADCSRIVTACDAARVGNDDRVQPAGYLVRYTWLRDLLEDRNDPTHSLRRTLLPDAEQRLVEQASELDHPQRMAPLTAADKAARDTVLRRSEFRTTADYSLTERIGAWIAGLLNRLFGGVSSLGRMAPWLGTTLQWGSLLLAAVFLLLWVYRALDRQRVALGKLSGDADRGAAHAASRAWAARARQHAERGEWRDAVHCLYWASVVLLEDRRTLRPNATRTPREALRLIDTSSAAREPLRLQTADFERIWYGLQPAAASDYEAALAHYNALQGPVRSAGAAA